MNKKLNYEAPLVELTEVRFSQNVLLNYSASPATPANATLYDGGDDQDW